MKDELASFVNEHQNEVDFEVRTFLTHSPSEVFAKKLKHEWNTSLWSPRKVFLSISIANYWARACDSSPSDLRSTHLCWPWDIKKAFSQSTKCKVFRNSYMTCKLLTNLRSSEVSLTHSLKVLWKVCQLERVFRNFIKGCRISIKSLRALSHKEDPWRWRRKRGESIQSHKLCEMLILLTWEYKSWKRWGWDEKRKERNFWKLKFQSKMIICTLNLKVHLKRSSWRS